METSVAPVAATLSGDRLNEAATQLRAAADARKCWSCGCFRHALEAFDRAIPEPERPAILERSCPSPGGCRKRWCLIRQATLLFSLTECAVD